MFSVVNGYLHHLSSVLCVFIVEGMSVVVNVMYIGSICFRGQLGFLNCDDSCMCVVNKQFELLEFVLTPFMLTCSMMRFLSLLLLGLCTCVVFVVTWWSVCL